MYNELNGCEIGKKIMVTEKWAWKSWLWNAKTSHTLKTVSGGRETVINHCQQLLIVSIYLPIPLPIIPLFPIPHGFCVFTSTYLFQYHLDSWRTYHLTSISISSMLAICLYIYMKLSHLYQAVIFILPPPCPLKGLIYSWGKVVEKSSPRSELLSFCRSGILPCLLPCM